MSRKVAPPKDQAGAVVPHQDPVAAIAAADTKSEAEQALERLQRERPDKVKALQLRTATLDVIEKNHAKIMKAMIDFAMGKFPKDVPAQALKAQSDILKALLDKLTVTVRENEQSGGEAGQGSGGGGNVTIVFKGVSGPQPVDGRTIEVG